MSTDDPGEGCPVTRSSPQRILIEEPHPVGESLNIPFESFREREKEMAKRGGHRPLMMGVTGHEGQTVFVCPLEQLLNQLDQSFRKLENLVPKVETHI